MSSLQGLAALLVDTGVVDRTGGDDRSDGPAGHRRPASAAEAPGSAGAAAFGAAWPADSSPAVERLMRVGALPVEPDDRLATAAAGMRAAGVGALAVLDAGRLVGLVTERDILRAVADGLSTDVTLVKAYMRSVPGVIPPEVSARAAAATMIELRSRHLPVVSAGEVVGLVSATDLLSEWGVPLLLLADDPLGT